LVLVALAAMPTAWAMEFGKPSVNDSVDDFLLAAMPPPGTYGIVYLSRYTSNFLADNAGNSSVNNFKLTANAIIPRADWIRPTSILGADRIANAIVAPYLNVNVKLSPAPDVELSDSKSGFGDIAILSGLHWTIGNYQMLNGVDVICPTGSFDATRLVNLGLNHWTVRLNHFGTWAPQDQWEISYGLRYDYNFENQETHYTSGQMGYVEAAVAYLPTPDLRLGVIGVLIRQLNDDSGPTAPRGGNKYSVNALGFGGNYALGHGVFVTAKYVDELAAKNAARGQLVEVYLAFPF
jgi:hypothetical protein